jgi:myo-inositol-1(or 4)-monophosphatase
MDRARVLLESARKACLEAGKAILEVPDRALRVSASGYSTRSDVISNGIILDALSSSFPGMPVISEEGGMDGTAGGPYWIVDPLDGTWNYHKGGARWSVSIACVDEGSPICGIVHAPALGETYEFAQGMPGPLLNGGPISPSRSAFPGEWIVAAGAPTSAMERAGRCLTDLARPMDTGDPRRPARINLVMYGRGSMALELCHLAAGRIDGLVRFGQRSWDLAGGSCIAEAAGCALEAMDGGRIWDRVPDEGGIDLLGATSHRNLSLLRGIASGEVGAWPMIKKK